MDIVLCLWRLFSRAGRTLVRTAEATSVLDWRVTERKHKMWLVG